MLAALSSSQLVWYVTRGSGVVALVLLTGSVVLGILEVKRWRTERWPRFVTAGLHKNVSLLSVAFLAVHVATSVVDGFAPIGWLDVVVPFRSPYRPLWLGLGTIAVDLLAAVVVTSLVRGRLRYRAWRAVHLTAYASWPVAVLHGLGTGTDTKVGLVLAITLACLGAVVLAVWWRLADGWRRRVGPSVAALGASVAIPIGIVAFLLAGPLRPGWARRAGTPRSIVKSIPTASAPPASTPTASAPSFAAPFTDNLSGTITQSADGTLVTIAGGLSGSAPGQLQIILRGQPSQGGGIVMASSSVSLGPSGNPSLYQGSVESLSGTRMQLLTSGPSGQSLRIAVALTLGDGATVTGTIQASAGAAASQGGGGG